MERHSSHRQDDEAALLFAVFDSEHRGFIEGKAIKKSLEFLALDNVPNSEINEILTKTRLTDDKKISIEGNCPPGGRDFHLNVTGVIVVPFRGYNSWFGTA